MNSRIQARKAADQGYKEEEGGCECVSGRQARRRPDRALCASHITRISGCSSPKTAALTGPCTHSDRALALALHSKMGIM